MAIEANSSNYVLNGLQYLISPISEDSLDTKSQI